MYVTDNASSYDRPKYFLRSLTQSYQVFLSRSLCLVPSVFIITQHFTQLESHPYVQHVKSYLNLLFLKTEVTVGFQVTKLCDFYVLPFPFFQLKATHPAKHAELLMQCCQVFAITSQSHAPTCLHHTVQVTKCIYLSE